MGGLAAAFADFVVFGEDPIHRAFRRQIGAFVEQLRVHRRWCFIDMLSLVEDLTHPGAFLGGERPWLGTVRPGDFRWSGG